MQGGKAGVLGKNTLKRANGLEEKLGATAEVQLEKDDAIIIQTPEGGGYGKYKIN